MGAANFCYENRCIVVTNEDFDFGNVPEHNEYDKKCCRSYPSYFLDDADFEFWSVVITSGYYEAACIDYKPKFDEYGFNMVESRMNYSFAYRTVKDLVKDFCDEFKLSVYRVRKLIGKLSECDCLSAFAERAFDRVNEYLSELEEIKVNEFLDRLKSDYGFEEYGVSARFSNGETWYSKI